MVLTSTLRLPSSSNLVNSGLTKGDITRQVKDINTPSSLTTTHPPRFSPLPTDPLLPSPSCFPYFSGKDKSPFDVGTPWSLLHRTKFRPWCYTNRRSFVSGLSRSESAVGRNRGRVTTEQLVGLLMSTRWTGTPEIGVNELPRVKEPLQKGRLRKIHPGDPTQKDTRSWYLIYPRSLPRRRPKVHLLCRRLSRISSTPCSTLRPSLRLRQHVYPSTF